MKNNHWLGILRTIGILIMIFSFAIVPEHYPWYYEILLFDVGLLMMLYAKSPKLRKSLYGLFSSNS